MLDHPRAVRVGGKAGIRLAVVRAPTRIDEAWLREQYLTRVRSFTDIAAELDVSEMTVIRAAHRHHIPARPPGVISRPALHRSFDANIPADVRRAVEGGLAGWQRLHRFEVAMRFPTPQAAADYLGADQATLVRQLQRLERDVGTRLFHRARHGGATLHAPQRPTPAGAALLKALGRADVHALFDRERVA